MFKVLVRIYKHEFIVWKNKKIQLNGLNFPIGTKLITTDCKAVLSPKFLIDSLNLLKLQVSFIVIKKIIINKGTIIKFKRRKHYLKTMGYKNYGLVLLVENIYFNGT